MSRLKACRCGRRWYANPRREASALCIVCRRAEKAAARVAALVAAIPRRRLPTLTEWRQLATDNEVRAGAAAWARGVRDPLTAAMADEHQARVGT